MINIDISILESDAFNLLIENSELMTFQKGDIIIESGKICKYLFLIESGLLRNFYYDLKGNDITHWFAKEKMFATVPPSFFKHEESFFHIEAIENTQVRALTYDNMEAAFQKSRVIERFGRLIVTEIMITLGRKVIDLQTKSAEQRYEELILAYPDILRRANLGHIASYLGITQQSLSRIRASK